MKFDWLIFIIVVSSSPSYDVSQWSHVRNYPFVSEAIHEAEQWITDCNYPPEICIIGGATIYEHTLPITDKVYLSKINTIVDGGDTFYPIHTLLANESVIPVLMKEYEPDGTTIEEDIYWGTDGLLDVIKSYRI